MKSYLYGVVGGSALLTLILVAAVVGGPLDWALLSVLIWAIGPYCLLVPLIHFAPPAAVRRPVMPAVLILCVGGVLTLIGVAWFQWDLFWVIWIPFIQWLLFALTAGAVWGARINGQKKEHPPAH